MTDEIYYLPFRVPQLRYMDVQDDQQKDAYAAMFNPATAHAFENSFGVSAWRGAEMLAAAGLIEKWAGSAVAYAFLSKNAGPYMLRFTKKIKTELAKVDFNRIELLVSPGFAAGHRWARSLGFELETPLAKCYDPAGNDFAIYVRIRPWLPPSSQ